MTKSLTQRDLSPLHANYLDIVAGLLELEVGRRKLLQPACTKTFAFTSPF